MRNKKTNCFDFGYCRCAVICFISLKLRKKLVNVADAVQESVGIDQKSGKCWESVWN